MYIKQNVSIIPLSVNGLNAPVDIKDWHVELKEKHISCLKGWKIFNWKLYFKMCTCVYPKEMKQI